MKTTTEKISCDICGEVPYHNNRIDICSDCKDKAKGLKYYKIMHGVGLSIAFIIVFFFAFLFGVFAHYLT